MTRNSSHPKTKPQFASDNYAMASPLARQYRDQAEAERFQPAYGNDAWTERAILAIRKYFELLDLKVFFVPTGTTANCLPLSHVTPPGAAIACCSTAHLVTDERGGPEYFSRAKIHTIPGTEHGQIDVNSIPRLFERTDPHWATPGCLSLTQSTELGTVYSLDAMDALREAKRRYGLLLHLDGARFANAVASLGVSPREITWKMDIDFMTLGVTKNGAPAGEAIVFFDPKLAAGFEGLIKASGNLVAKMSQITAPICGLFETGEFAKNAEHANKMAVSLSRDVARVLELNGHRGCIRYPVESNAVFVDFPDGVLQKLRDRGWLIYSFIGGAARLMTSWATEASDITALLNDVRDVLATSSAQEGQAA